MRSVVLILAATLHAQSEAPLAFEVASVKQHPIREGFVRRAQSSNLQCPPFHCGISGNRFAEELASLTDLIMDAYSVMRYQISGLPDWGDSGHDVYDIAATIEGDRAPTPTQVRQMLQTLLADRFQLKLHKETRELPFFALVPAKSGLKLTLVPQEDGKPLVLTCGGSGGEGPSVETVAFHRSWERMPELLSLNSDRPVIDKTGLKGLYCTRDGQDPAMAVMSSLGNSSRGRGGPNPNADDPASIFTVLEQKLGLRLEPQKGPLEILVIDHVARPTVN